MKQLSTSHPERMSRALVYGTDVLEPLRDLTAYAEGAGFDRVWTTDFPGRDALARALYLALRSTSIGVGTGIAYAFTRAPLALASEAADIQQLSGGRFILGLGTGTRGVRRWYDAAFDPPATRFASLADELRGYWADESGLEDVGPPPLAGAGLNVAMLRTVARVCDWVLLHPLCLVGRYLDDHALPAVSKGSSSRAFGPPKLAAWCIASVDSNGEAARSRARRQVGFYATTPSFRTVFAGGPFAGVAARIRDEFEQMMPVCDWEALGRLVPDELLEQVAVAGTPEQVRAQTFGLERRLAARGVSQLVLQTSGIGADREELVTGARLIIGALSQTSARGAYQGLFAKEAT